MTWTPEIIAAAAFAALALILLLIIAARINRLQDRMASLGRIEGKLDLLLKQANLKYDPYAHVASDVVEALRRNQKIEAIKLYRQATGVGLKEAKDYVEGMQRRAGLE
jgi:ribosomal protein L7/L12